ncbi:hypothetical protein PCC7424_4891 [Gloeothece citriformis PCC 7424]|uniref:DUF2934 domain-containing protein n=1 Tax=Gloeothece citriformis (strain PCC 7424) TaxID=65393 RepID=B7KED0_GLOC7|nr:DUF2934 domain-containing protein [Gloeothece citriformis]ACK73248.1 hypothetical protein PCC7424_4891 [Gloeothece citriformis PCC 7424]
MNDQEIIAEKKSLIRAKAYEIWQTRGGTHGQDQQDWDVATEKFLEEHFWIKDLIYLQRQLSFPFQVGLLGVECSIWFTHQLLDKVVFPYSQTTESENNFNHN